MGAVEPSELADMFLAEQDRRFEESKQGKKCRDCGRCVLPDFGHKDAGWCLEYGEFVDPDSLVADCERWGE